MSLITRVHNHAHMDNFARKHLRHLSAQAGALRATSARRAPLTLSQPQQDTSAVEKEIAWLHRAFLAHGPSLIPTMAQIRARSAQVAFLARMKAPINPAPVHPEPSASIMTPSVVNFVQKAHGIHSMPIRSNPFAFLALRHGFAR